MNCHKTHVSILKPLYLLYTVLAQPSQCFVSLRLHWHNDSHYLTVTLFTSDGLWLLIRNSLQHLLNGKPSNYKDNKFE